MATKRCRKKTGQFTKCKTSSRKSAKKSTKKSAKRAPRRAPKTTRTPAVRRTRSPRSSAVTRRAEYLDEEMMTPTRRMEHHEEMPMTLRQAMTERGGFEAPPHTRMTGFAGKRGKKRAKRPTKRPGSRGCGCG